MKEFFRFPAHFLQKFFQKQRRQGAKPPKRNRRVHPKVPKGPQQGAAQAKIQRRPQKRAQQQVQPQLPLHRPQGVADQPHPHAQAKQQIAQHQQPFAAPPHGPQQVVSQSQNGAQQRRPAEQQQLLRNIVFHGPYPNSRARKPPPSRRFSSYCSPSICPSTWSSPPSRFSWPICK